MRLAVPFLLDDEKGSGLMVLARVFPEFAICLFAITLAAGQTTKPLLGPDISTVSTDKSKPAAGIPLTKAGRGKKDDPADRRIAQQIRRSMTNDRSLSPYARNVSITCQNGIVTLRGPVGSGEEKQNLKGKAADVAGNDHVRSELAVMQSN